MVHLNIQNKLTTDDCRGGVELQESNGQSKRHQSSSASSASVLTSVPRTTSVSTWEFRPIRRLYEVFDRMFDQTIGNWPVPGEMGGGSLGWGCFLQKDESSVAIRAAVPGFELSDVGVRLRGNQLIPTAARHGEGRYPATGCRQWQDRDFFRSMARPEGTAHSNVGAHDRNGVLTIRLAKRELAKFRRVPIHG